MGRKKRSIMAAALAVSLLLAPRAAEAKEIRGARLRIMKTDFRVVEGELLKVSGETLVLFNDKSQQGIQIGLSEVRSLGVRRKRNALVGIGTGFFVGLISAKCLAGIVAGGDSDIYELDSIIFPIISVPAGMLTGGLISGLRKPYRKLAATGLGEEEREKLLAELAGLSREGRNEAAGK